MSPPIIAASSSPSGFSARRICASTPGRSLTNWSASAETARSSDSGCSGRDFRGRAETDARDRLDAIGQRLLQQFYRRPDFGHVGKRRASPPPPLLKVLATRSSRKVTAAPARAVQPRRKQGTVEQDGRGVFGSRPCRLVRRLPGPGNPVLEPRVRAALASPHGRRGTPSRSIIGQLRGALRAATAAKFGALDIALPTQCVSCREPVDGEGVCAECWAKLSFIAPPFCPRLGIPFVYDPGPELLSMEAIANPPAYQRARAAVRYDDVARTLVHSLKYQDRTDLAPAMGRWMARAGKELLDAADVLVPVPLHWRRGWEPPLQPVRRRWRG